MRSDSNLKRELGKEKGGDYEGLPGIIDTEIHASGGQPHRVADLAPSLPMKRAGTGEEVARAILWLASSEASYSTGAILDVSGARSILP